MGIKTYNPVTPSRRQMASADYAEVTRDTPFKGLLAKKKEMAGRNNLGRVTMRRRGGGHKKRLRVIDFRRDKDGIPARVETIEYDPNRTSRIALVCYRDGERRYILAPNGLNVGDTIMSGSTADIRTGNALELRDIPVGTIVHAVEMMPKRGAQMAKSAGAAVQVMAREGEYVTLRLPSGEVRKVPAACYATIGQVGNADHEGVVLGKAGRSRHRGIRPINRGVARNPVDHPNGGGAGKRSEERRVGKESYQPCRSRWSPYH